MKLALFGLALVASPALAQDMPPAPPAPGAAMMRADTNGDGVVTRDEMIAQATQRFDRLDLNHDGKLTADEMQRMGGRRGAMRGGEMPPPPPQN